MALTPSLVRKLTQLTQRAAELSDQLGLPEVVQDSSANLGKEHAQIEPTVNLFQQYQQVQTDLTAAEAMSQESDAEMRALALGNVRASKNNYNH